MKIKKLIRLKWFLSHKLLAGLVVFFFSFLSIPVLTDSSTADALSRMDCNSRERQAQCKQDYDKCDEKGSGPAINRCKRDVLASYAGHNQCGKGDSKVVTKINLGCNGAHENPIVDVAFALIRFLSIGVGIVVIASVVFAGVQYTTSEGNPEKTAQAKSRIQNSMLALIFYLFIFSIVQFLIPGGLFN